jgi:hypothetical protein
VEIPGLAYARIFLRVMATASLARCIPILSFPVAIDIFEFLSAAKLPIISFHTVYQLSVY